MFAIDTRGLEIPDRPRNRSTPNKSLFASQNVYFQFHSARLDSTFYTTVLRTDMMASKRVVRIEDRLDRWRFVCPRGHRSWEPTNHHFWCQQCASQYEIDGVFYQLRDRRSGELYEREEVRLVDSVGPYDKDLDGGRSK